MVNHGFAKKHVVIITWTLHLSSILWSIFLCFAVTVQGLMNMDPCTSQYFLHWASLLSVEQYHHMTEAADRANEAVTFMKVEFLLNIRAVETTLFD